MDARSDIALPVSTLVSEGPFCLSWFTLPLADEKASEGSSAERASHYMTIVSYR